MACKDKIQIGDVLICAATQANPYKGSLTGPWRRNALIAFRDGCLPANLAAWYGPSCGGARRLTDATEVDWARSGLER
jgi:hypothetical protein